MIEFVKSFEDSAPYNKDTSHCTLFVYILIVKTGRETYYDAFIGHYQDDDNDRKFLLELIDELEQKRKLKLFVPGRDDLPGGAEHTITAYVIEKRFQFTFILMSSINSHPNVVNMGAG